MTINDAVTALAVAENHFQHAEPEYVDAAIYELLAARARLDGMVKEAKEMSK